MTTDDNEEEEYKVPKPKSLKELNVLSKKDLKALCSKHGLAVSGTRATLFERLSNFYDYETDEDKEVEKEEETEAESKEEIEEPESSEKESVDVTEEAEEETVISGEAEEAEEDDTSAQPEEEPKKVSGYVEIEPADDLILYELFKLNISRDRQDDLQHVLDGYNALHQAYPENEYILINKGLCLQYLQDYDTAVQCYVDALKINPQNIEARILLEGCRIMGITKAQQLPAVIAKPEVTKPVDKSEESAAEIPEHSEEMLAEERPLEAEEQEPELAEPPEEGAVDKVVAEDAGQEQQDAVEEPHLDETSDDGVQIAGSQAPKEERHSLFGEEIGTIDTSSLTESKSKLTSVLAELKSELGSPMDKGKNDLGAPPESKAGIPEADEGKPIDFEKQSIKEMLDSKKSDENFGSKILDSARKLLDMSETLSETSFSTDITNELSSGTKLTDLREGLELADKKTEDLIKPIDKPVAADEKAEPEAAEPPKPKKPKKKVRLRTGNISLDKLLHGGFMSGSNVLVDGPQFVGKDIVLYKFATLGFRMNTPCIIVNPVTAPNTIRDTFNKLLGDISEYEKKGLLIWLDPEDEKVKEKFKRQEPTDFPEMHQLLLDGLKHFSSEILSDYEAYNLIFFSVTPLISFHEPPVINKFLKRFSDKIKDDNVVALYTIDNTMHETQELNFVRRVMDGILEIKQEVAYADHANPRNLIKIDKIPYAGSYDWHEYKSSDKSFEIKAIPTYKTVM